MVQVLATLALLAGPEHLAWEPGPRAGLVLVFVPHEQPGEAAFEEDVRGFRAALTGVGPFRGRAIGIARLRPFESMNRLCQVVVAHEVAPWIRCERWIAKSLDRMGLPPGYKLVILSRAKVPSRANVSEAGTPSVVFMAAGDGALPFARVVRHEVGHAFGLSDERAVVMADHVSAARRQGLNCVPGLADAKSRFGVTTALEQGCAGHAEWWRPAGASVMAGDGDDYGPVVSRLLAAALDSKYGRSAPVGPANSRSRLPVAPD